MNVSTKIPSLSFPQSLSSVSDQSQTSLTATRPPDSPATEPTNSTPDLSSGPTLRQEIQIFTSTFLAILLAEIGDKTQVATLLMSAGSANPWIVFAGSSVALVATSLIGVLVGRWLATKISTRTLETGAGALLLVISVLLLWDVVHL